VVRTPPSSSSSLEIIDSNFSRVTDDREIYHRFLRYLKENDGIIA
jgi:hypothetical protein